MFQAPDATSDPSIRPVLYGAAALHVASPYPPPCKSIRRSDSLFSGQMLLYLLSEFTEFISQFFVFSRQTYNVCKHRRPDNRIGGKQKPKIFHTFSPRLV